MGSLFLVRGELEVLRRPFFLSAGTDESMISVDVCADDS
jgi:hypothetical protein